MNIKLLKVFRPIPIGGGFSKMETTFRPGMNCDSIVYEQDGLIKVKHKNGYFACGIGNVEFFQIEEKVKELPVKKKPGRPKKHIDEEAVWS